jgi:hypothetical protein
VAAQPPATASPPTDPTPVVLTAQTPSTTDDDPAALDPIEPDFSLVNLPTTLRLPVRKWDFHLTHRFNLNLICSEFEDDCFADRLSNLFGLDNGANIGLEFRFGVMRNLQAVVVRTSLSQIIQMSLQYDALHQNGSRPVSISGIASIEGDHNFGASTPDIEDTHYSPALGLVVSRKIANRLAVYLEPFWVNNTAAAGLPTRDTGFVGVGGRLRLSSTVYLVGEVSPRIGGLVTRDPQFGFAIEKRAGGHMFSLTFTNSPGTTFRQISSGGNPDTLTLGFNLSRKFY